MSSKKRFLSQITVWFLRHCLKNFIKTVWFWSSHLPTSPKFPQTLLRRVFFHWKNFFKRKGLGIITCIFLIIRLSCTLPLIEVLHRSWAWNSNQILHKCIFFVIFSSSCNDTHYFWTQLLVKYFLFKSQRVNWIGQWKGLFEIIWNYIEVIWNYIEMIWNYIEITWFLLWLLVIHDFGPNSHQ